MKAIILFSQILTIFLYGRPPNGFNLSSRNMIQIYLLKPWVEFPLQNPAELLHPFNLIPPESVI